MYFYSLDEITGTARLIEEIKRWVGTVHALINCNILRVLFCPALPGGVLHASRDFQLNECFLNKGYVQCLSFGTLILIMEMPF